jgi:hypothetical protein
MRMINKSKIGSPGQWKKWEKSGAIGEHPDAEIKRKEMAKKREKEAKIYLEEMYDFSDHAISDEVMKRFIEKMDEENETNNIPGHYQTTLDKVAQYPEIPEEQFIDFLHNANKFGMTNNFWRQLFPDNARLIKEELAKGKIPKGVIARFYYWQQKGYLMKAFETIGFERVKKMHEAFKLYFELDDKWRELGNEDPQGLPHSSWQLEHSPLNKEDRKLFLQAQHEYTNTLRLLAIELRRMGVSASSIFG